MYTAWIYDAFDAAYQDTGDEALANYYVADDRSDIGYIQFFIHTRSAASVNAFRRYAEHAKPYGWNIRIERRGDYYGDYYSAELYVDAVADRVI